ncbi:hypothetical protein KR009_003214, partial [Drosophila setifemur]
PSDEIPPPPPAETLPPPTAEIPPPPPADPPPPPPAETPPPPTDEIPSHSTGETPPPPTAETPPRRRLLDRIRPSRLRPLEAKTRHQIRVYVIFAVLLFIGLTPLLYSRYKNFNFSANVGEAVPSNMWLLVCCSCLAILTCVDMSRSCPINYLLACITVESSVCFILCSLKLNLPWTIGIIGFVLAACILLFMIGIFMPLKVLPGFVAVIVCTLTLLVSTAFMYVIVYFNGNRFLMRYVWKISFVFEAILVVFTITVVHQRRFGYLAQSDHVFQATILAFLFVFMFHSIKDTVGLIRFISRDY